MISVEEAESLVLENMTLGPTMSAPIADVHGEVLREAITADRPFPPFHRVAMDGIAFNRQSWCDGRRVFAVAGIQRAGESSRTLDNPDACYEVMTGAVLPEGCDCVVPVEQIEMENGTAKVGDMQAIASMQNVHMLGFDRECGASLLGSGSILFGPQCAIAATVGKENVLIAARPRIGVVSTGDELVSVSDVPEPHQIRGSNGYALRASLREAGFDDVELHHMMDDADEIRRGLADLLDSSAFLLVCGGVSAGRYDYVPGVLRELGVRQVFHKVSQRPGMPLWFGIGQAGQAVFGLPGNPVSGVICCQRFVLPALWQSMGAVVRPAEQRPGAPLSETITFKKSLTLFKPVATSVSEGNTRCVTPHKMGGSGDLAGLAESDGFVELPAHQDVFEAGSTFPIWLWSEPYGQLVLH